MKITFPHMGNVYIAGKGMLEDLGREVVLPPPCSKKTLEIGTKYSPESICLPLKINIGNYIESIERGADTILLTGSCGPCRYGFYSVIEKNILKELGYNVDFIVFDPPEGKPSNLINSFKKAAGTDNVIKIFKGFYKGKKIIEKADNLTKLSNIKRAHAIYPEKVDNIMNDFYKDIEDVHGSSEIISFINYTNKRINSVKEKKQSEYMKVGIVGEIYTIIEPFVNLEIEKKLGHFGIEVEKSLTPSKWLSHHLGLGNIGISEERKKWKAAKPYLRTLVGGHGRETVGSAILYAKEDYDGVIQILPFNCMPEIVAESILPTVQKDYNIPILTLVVDEMTGEAGYLTRLEAFVDLLKKRREEKKNGELLLRG
ncbi:MAG: CoA protein activase [Firmicutes bacterium]|nr:CoA protein activase [Bacillota bacterium]